MIELLYSSFELHGRKHFSQGKAFDVSLSDDEVVKLAEKMLPLPYSERGGVMESIRNFISWSSRSKSGPKWEGPVTAKLLNAVVDLTVEKYEAMQKAAKRIRRSDFSFVELSSLKYELPEINSIEMKWKNKLNDQLQERMSKPA